MSATDPQIGSELRKKIAEILTWRSGLKRAPHKPLQLLLAIAHAEKGAFRLESFVEIEPVLRAAIGAFGPVRKTIHPEYPFWHLQTDGIWEVQADSEVRLRKNSLNPTARELRRINARGGIASAYYSAVRASEKLRMDLVHDILDTHFPPSIHEDILSFFGLGIRQDPSSSRDEGILFRKKVLTAYDQICAVSGFSVNMGGLNLGIEPAHILWPQAGGRDLVANAMAMTTLHRKLFHLGVFTIDESFRVKVSSQALGNNGFFEILGRFDGRKVSLPPIANEHPSQEFLSWHRDQVFRH